MVQAVVPQLEPTSESPRKPFFKAQIAGPLPQGVCLIPCVGWAWDFAFLDILLVQPCLESLIERDLELGLEN